MPLYVQGKSTDFARHLSLLVFKVEGAVPSWADSHRLWGVTSPELKGAKWTEGTVAWGMAALACPRARWELFSPYLSTTRAWSPDEICQMFTERCVPSPALSPGDTVAT